MPSPIRPQPYRLKWPLTPSQVEGLDEMLQILFKAIRTGGGGTSASTALATVVSGIGPPGSDGADGDEGAQGPQGPRGATGVTGAQGPVGLGFPGYDGEDGVDSIVPGPPGNAGAPGSQGAQGPVGMGVPGADGEDGMDGWPGPPGVSASGAAGALVLLEQHTAATSSSLDFTTCITSVYDDYIIDFVGVILVTDNTGLKLLCSTNGGASYDTSAIYDSVFHYISTNSSTAAAGAVNQTFMDLSGNSDFAATGGVNGFLRFVDPLSTTRHKSFHGHLNYAHDTVGRIYVMRGALYKNTAAVNAFRIIPVSGNIASGTVRVYGIAK